MLDQLDAFFLLLILRTFDSVHGQTRLASGLVLGVALVDFHGDGSVERLLLIELGSLRGLLLSVFTLLLSRAEGHRRRDKHIWT